MAAKKKQPTYRDLSNASPAKVAKAFAGVQLLGSRSDLETPDVLPTGLDDLDNMFGVGGFPLARVAEFYGPEASGKTSLALLIAGCAQQAGGKATFVDVEHALDLNMARWFGVNTDDLLFSQPDSGEQALDVVFDLLSNKGSDIIIVDSVAALVPESELWGGQNQIGSQARLVGGRLKKIVPAAKRANAAVIFINQIRMKIGVMFGNPETTPGGNALKFAASLRVDIRRTKTVKTAGGKAVGIDTRVKTVKNKVAPPFQECELRLVWGKGFKAKKKRNIME